MKKYEELKKEVLKHSISSLKFLRTMMDYGIGILEREADDMKTGKKEKEKRIQRIKIE